MVAIFFIAAAIFVTPALIFSVIITLETAASYLYRRPAREYDPARYSILIPAHNEAEIIAETVRGLLNNNADPRRSILVVADNCTDDTATQARAAGAEVIERVDPENRGKGFALQAGIDALSSSPPDVVVVFDADCTVANGTLSTIVRRAADEQRPVQAMYLMKTPPEAPAKTAIAEFAWMFINKVRMTGLMVLSGGSRMTGSGTAIPWGLVSSERFASSEIVEDLALSYRFAKARTPIVLDTSVEVHSDFPVGDHAQLNQSSRWSVGSIKFGWSNFLPTFSRALFSANMPLMMLALDGLVPPLTLLAAYIVIANIVSALALLVSGSAILLVLSIAASVLAFLSIFSSWFFHGRTILGIKNLRAFGSFLIAKLSVFGTDGRRRAARWTPTREKKPNE